MANEGKTSILSGVILSYPVLFTPRADDNGKLKYSVSALATDPNTFNEAKTAALAVLTEKYGTVAKAKEMIKSGKVHWPFRKDVASKDGYSERGVVEFSSLSTIRKPTVVSRYAAAGSTKPEVITDETKVYGGMLGNVSYNAYWFEGPKKKGVSLGLNNVQVMGEGERFGAGASRAEDEFDVEEAATADLSDLESGADEEPDAIDDLADLK